MGNTVKVLDNPEMKEKLKIAPETKEKLKIAPEKLKIAPEMNRKSSITPSIVVSSELSPPVAPKQITNIDIEKDGNLLCPKYRTRSDSIDPFTHDLNPGFKNVIQIIFMSITLAPLRLMCIVFLLFTGWCFAKIGLCGTGGGSYEEESNNQLPFKSWRKCIQRLLLKILRLTFFCMGFHKINVIGHQAPRQLPKSSNNNIVTRDVAPILVCAPHATLVDAIAILVSRSVPLAKKALSEVTFLGAIGQCMQVLFVSREQAASRKDVVSQIKKRATDEAVWPQIFIFPEGTCTNGRALIKFKTGAFQPGCSVQPVLIRRPTSGLDTLTWTWHQSYGAMGCLWLTLCQWSSVFEVEFLPVYHPNKEEREDPRLFASNVRLRMATRLGVPMSERSVTEFTSSSMWSVNSAMHLDERIEFAPPYVLDFVGNLTHN